MEESNPQSSRPAIVTVRAHPDAVWETVVEWIRQSAKNVADPVVELSAERREGQYGSSRVGVVPNGADSADIWWEEPSSHPTSLLATANEVMRNHLFEVLRAKYKLEFPPSKGGCAAAVALLLAGVLGTLVAGQAWVA